MRKVSPKKLSITVRGATYPIIIGIGLEKELLNAVVREGKRRVVIITDTTTRRLFGGRLARVLKKGGRSVDMVSFPAGERSKNQRTVDALQHALLKKRCGRDTLIIALGGGVVGDVAGYVAATYLRGIPYIQMPTTLLAIIDSSVGGKVGVDTKYGKNLIGAFYQPRAVIADLSFVSTLSEVQVVNGLMEAVKKFLTSDKPSLALALKLDTKRPLKNPKLLQDIVYRSVRSKARVVMMDEEEKNKRRILSFGHTVGHAVEFLSGYALPHGFAISYGMLVEAKVSEFSGILSAKDFAFVAAFLRHFGFRSKVLRKYPVTKVLKVIRGDKKVRRGVPHYVLLASIGSIYKKGGQYAHPVSDRIVRRAYETLIGE